MTSSLPPFDELPVREGAPPGSSWGVWGDRDVFGCLNLLTPERVLAGVGSVRRGDVFPLNLELELPDPPLFGRKSFEHEVMGLGGIGHDEQLHGWNTQSSSQWDGFRHLAHRRYAFYGGVADEDHGIHHWARRGIVGRGVLADVARWRAAQGRPIDPGTADAIEPEDVLATLDAQNATVDPGDILLLRTGWLGWYRGLEAEERERLATGTGTQLRTCGLRPGTATSRLLWDLHIAAVAADNPAVEMWPPGALVEDRAEAGAMLADPDRSPEVFVHFSLLALLGLPLGELWDLDALAADCAEDGVYAFLLTSAPLNLHRGVASPPNALAIK